MMNKILDTSFRHNYLLAMMLSPAITFWPNATCGLYLEGRYTSTREPNLIRPNLSPTLSESNSSTKERILLAISPAIWTTIISSFFSNFENF